MRFLKIIFGFLFFIILVTAVLSLILPDKQEVKRSISISAPAAVIFEELKKLENFNKIAVWSKADSSAAFSIDGTDGTVGASTSWSGHPMISGEGKITITELIPGKKIAHRIDFTLPKKGKADSSFDLEETNQKATTVTWTMQIATPRPWNIFNLFYSVDKERGAEFEQGLKVLRTLIEAKE